MCMWMCTHIYKYTWTRMCDEYQALIKHLLFPHGTFGVWSLFVQFWSCFYYGFLCAAMCLYYRKLDVLYICRVMQMSPSPQLAINMVCQSVYAAASHEKVSQSHATVLFMHSSFLHPQQWLALYIGKSKTIKQLKSPHFLSCTCVIYLCIFFCLTSV